MQIIENASRKKKYIAIFNCSIVMCDSSVARKEILITSSHFTWLLFIYQLEIMFKVAT